MGFRKDDSTNINKQNSRWLWDMLWWWFKDGSWFKKNIKTRNSKSEKCYKSCSTIGMYSKRVSQKVPGQKSPIITMTKTTASIKLLSWYFCQTPVRVFFSNFFAPVLGPDVCCFQLLDFSVNNSWLYQDAGINMFPCVGTLVQPTYCYFGRALCVSTCCTAVAPFFSSLPRRRLLEELSSLDIFLR